MTKLDSHVEIQNQTQSAEQGVQTERSVGGKVLDVLRTDLIAGGVAVLAVAGLATALWMARHGMHVGPDQSVLD